MMWGFLPELEKVPPTESNYIDLLMGKLRKVEEISDKIDNPCDPLRPHIIAY